MALDRTLDRLAQLQADNDELRERVRQLEAILSSRDWLPWFIRRQVGGLRQTRLLNVLRHAGQSGASAQRLYDGMYFDDPNGGPDDRRIVSVMICKLGKKLAPYGIQIETTGAGRSEGSYRLAPDAVRRIEDLRAAEAR